MWTWPWRCTRVVVNVRIVVSVVVVQPDIAAVGRLGRYEEDDWGLATRTAAAQVGSRRVVAADSLARPLAIIRVADIGV